MSNMLYVPFSLLIDPAFDHCGLYNNSYPAVVSSSVFWGSCDIRVHYFHNSRHTVTGMFKTMCIVGEITFQISLLAVSYFSLSSVSSVLFQGLLTKFRFNLAFGMDSLALLNLRTLYTIISGSQSPDDQNHL